jgi:diguanylate cyclase
MSAIVHLIVTLAFMGLGVAMGWSCRGKPRPPAKPPSPSADDRRARDLLARLQSLAARISVDISQHQGQVGTIKDELRSAKAPRPEDVVDAVGRLVEINEQVQRRLAESETKLREQAQQLDAKEAEARTDGLTGLANRRALDDELHRRVAESRRHGRPLCVVHFDLDHFKRLNDTHGHQGGDAVLRGVARVLRGTLRESDLVARYGGEEFTAVLPDATLGDARQVADRARRNIEGERFEFHGQHLQVTTSVGVAELAADEDVAALLRRADEALYAAKQGGRNCVYWHDGRQAQSVDLESPTEKTPQDDVPVDERVCCDRDDSAPPRTENQDDGPSCEEARDEPRGRASEAGQARADTVRWCNRTGFCQHVRRHIVQWRQGGPTLCVMIVEVDGYDHILAKHGPSTAASVVSAMRKFLSALARQRDVLADYGQGTFGVLLPRTAQKEAVALAEGLRRAISRYEMSRDGVPLRFTVSVGVSEVGVDDDLIRFLSRAESTPRGVPRPVLPARAATAGAVSVDCGCTHQRGQANRPPMAG